MLELGAGEARGMTKPTIMDTKKEKRMYELTVAKVTISL